MRVARFDWSLDDCQGKQRDEETVCCATVPIPALLANLTGVRSDQRVKLEKENRDRLEGGQKVEDILYVKRELWADLPAYIAQWSQRYTLEPIPETRLKRRDYLLN